MSRSHPAPEKAPDALTATTALGPLQARVAARAPTAGPGNDHHAAGRAFTCAAEECVMDLIARDHAGLVAHSADVLAELLRIWAEQGVDAEEVWTELDRRTRMGNLLLSLNMTRRRATPATARKRSWKIRTTKLP
ncbi:phosphoribosyl-ATP pyrophosphatase [Komagataeibacter rhaeticus]|uniref:phosphoribosyl-ATP pyrophosphatase n=1 Tax=Komagataeibacter rhaeticus TaxID=215221 RepID=UPI0039EC6ADF